MENQTSFVMAAFQYMVAILGLCNLDKFRQSNFLRLLTYFWIDYLEMVCGEKTSILISSKSNCRLSGLHIARMATPCHMPLSCTAILLQHISLMLYDIRTTNPNDPGRVLGSLAFSESFFDSRILTKDSQDPTTGQGKSVS
jgi:hypothetical protein